MRHLTFKRACAIATSAFLASTLTIHLPQDSSNLPITLDTVANAKSSGGRSGGGSFRKTSPSSPSRPSTPSQPSQNFNSPNQQPGRNYNNGPVIVPVPVGPRTYVGPGNSYNTNTQQASANNTGDAVLGFVILAIGAIIFIVIIVLIVKAINKRKGVGSELENDIITISKLQVALLAEARSIQEELTTLSLELESDSEWGLLQLLQESALALLRTPENWSHVLASSQTVKTREEAESVFNQISIGERKKFTVETLTNVGGRVRQAKDFQPDPDKDPASYIVVTLLVGTAHDQPLFDEKIHTVDELKAALEKMAALPSEYLMVFELIWSPQDSNDSLTYDELLTEYSDMVQL